jgi:alpha-mannosidase
MEKSLSGPYTEKVTARIKLKESTINVTYTLNTGQPFIEIEIETMWLEVGSGEKGTPTLRMQFPFAIENAHARYEIPYGSIERKLNAGEEVPALRWADVAGTQKGTDREVSCTLLNDCKYGHSLNGSTLRLTLIRSSIRPDPIPEVGHHTMRMALLPEGRVLEVNELKKYGYNFNHPLQVINTDIHQGTFPSKSEAIISVNSPNVLLTAIKKAESNNDIILRFLETNGISDEVDVQINDQYFGQVSNAFEVDLLERPLDNSTVKLENNLLTFNVGSYCLTSLRITF